MPGTDTVQGAALGHTVQPWRRLLWQETLLFLGFVPLHGGKEGGAWPAMWPAPVLPGPPASPGLCARLPSEGPGGAETRKGVVPGGMGGAQGAGGALPGLFEACLLGLEVVASGWSPCSLGTHLVSRWLAMAATLEHAHPMASFALSHGFKNLVSRAVTL